MTTDEMRDWLKLPYKWLTVRASPNVPRRAGTRRAGVGRGSDTQGEVKG